MTKQHLIQKITTVVHKEIPEILELKFGCLVSLKPTRRGVLYAEKFPSKKFWLNEDRNRWETKNGWIDRTEMTSLIMNEDVEILGRPITLSDILITIGKKDLPMSINLRLWNELKSSGIEIFYSKGDGEIINIDWDLTQNLQGQSVETLMFISNLLA